MGTRSFRASLILRAIVIVLAALGVFSASVYRFIVVPTVKQIASAQMGQAAEQIDGMLTRLLGSVEITVRTSRHWGLSGVIDQNSLVAFKDLYVSVIGNHPEISSVIFAHESGREVFLLHTDDGRWLNRLTDPAHWGRRAYWLTWAADGNLEKVEVKDTDYDSRTRPWFKGAMALPDDGALHWTPRYTFFTTREPGITAAARWTAADGSHYVIAHDVNLLDLSRFTSQVTAGRNGFAAILQKDGSLVGLPRNERFKSDEEIKAAMHRSVDDLDLPMLSEGLKRWQAGGGVSNALSEFEVQGQRWFSLFRPLTLGDQTFWLGVWAPQADFPLGDASDLGIALALAAATLALAALIVLPMARRLAKPLESLAEDSARIGRMELATPVAVHSPWREVARLAGAQETMRQALLRATEALRQANETLEAKVAERTGQLAEALASARAAEAATKSAVDEQAAIFHSAGLGITVVRDRRFVRLNRRLAEMLGRTVEEMEGQSTRILFERQEDYEELGRIGYETIFRGETFRGEYRMQRKDGSGFWCRESGRVIDLAAPERGSVWVLEDVTAEREAKRLLEETEAWYRAILESAPVGLLVVDQRGTVIHANREIQRLFGYAPDELVGRSSELLVAEGEYAGTLAEIRERLAAKARETGDRAMLLPARRKDGSGFPMEAELSYLPAREGIPRQLAVMIIDVTLRQQQEEALKRVATLAEEATRLKSDFLANMSHEIRTPMNAIIGMAHLTMDTELSERQRNYVGKIQAAAQHLLGVINDILDFSKIEAGKLTVEKVGFNLDTVLENVITLIGDKAAAKGLELLVDVPRSVPRQLVGDPLRLGQILINYANNAVKFTERGEIDIRVRVERETDGEVQLRFSVRDTGIGIAAEQLNQLFSSFTQADTSTTRKYGGTGLGLAISARFARMMDGEVGVDSEPGRGSTFWFTAVLGKGQEGDARQLPDPDLRGRRALVVDDNENARVILADMLAGMTFRIGSCGSGAAALAELERAAKAGEPYELAFIDWLMPAMDGIETIRQIHRLNLARPPHCVMVTAFGREEVIRSAQSAGFREVLIKPVTPSQLFDTAMRAFGDRTAEPRAARVRPAGPPTGLAAIRGARLLLVEDNELNQEVASELLRHAGVEVDVAGDGEQAIARLAGGDYDLVLMDVQMPVMDGITATETIRRAGYRLPIVAMTASVMPKDRDRCRTAGMNDHLAKPIEPDELWAILLKWIEPRQAADSPSPPAAAAPAVDLGLPTGVDGLDTDSGLQRVLGNRALYQSLLRKFVASQGNATAMIRAALAAGNRAHAQRIAHTLKGLSRGIGAEPLAAEAAAVESVIRDGEAAEVVGGALEALAAPLATLVGQLQRLLPADPARVIDEPSGLRLPEIRTRLLALLNDGDLQALDLLEQEAGILRAAYGERFAQIETAVRSYEFDRAIAEIGAH